MTTNTKKEAGTTWGEVEERVLAALDLDDPGVRYAVKRWREEVAEARHANDAGRVIHTFTSPEAIEATVNFLKADIAENEVIYRLKVARNKRRTTLMNLHATLGEHDGFFVDEEEGERVVPERLAVIRIDKTARVTAMHRMVEASMKLAKSDGDSAGEGHTFPNELGDGIQDFANDLREFVRVNGDEGRQLVIRVCEDRDFAAKVAADEEMPNPLRFLAQVAVQTVMKNCLPERPPVLGFGRR